MFGLGDGNEEHPIDILVATRLPQTDLKENILDTVDAIRVALRKHPSLWMELEEKLNEYNTARNEEYFNIGYEHGVAAGRAHALDSLRANTSPDTQKLAEQLRALAKNNALPASTIVAVLLEVTWTLAHEIVETATPAESQ